MSHTEWQADKDSLWAVDLEQNYTIQSIRIINQYNCCKEHLANFNIILLDTDCKEIKNNTVVVLLGVKGWLIGQLIS